MNKFDEQPDKGSHSPGEDVKTSPRVAPSVPRSRPIDAEVAAVPPMDLRLEQDSLQVVTSKTTSRRVWLRRGVAVASPVVASLVSAPVYAAGACVMATGLGSIPTFRSRNPAVQGLVCTTQGPNYFHSNFATAGVWPTSPTDTKTEIFKAVFGVPANVETGITGATTLDQVLGISGISDLAKYSIAAYLNVRKGTANFPFSSTQQVFDVYRSYHGGPFSVLLISNPKWTETQTVDWLKILMT